MSRDKVYPYKYWTNNCNYYLKKSCDGRCFCKMRWKIGTRLRYPMYRIRREKTMKSNNSKYSVEMREKKVAFFESGKSPIAVAKELGMDKNTVFNWVRDYRRRNNLSCSLLSG